MFCAFRLFYFMFFAVFVLYFSSDDKAAVLAGAEIAFAADQYRVFRKSDIHVFQDPVLSGILLHLTTEKGHLLIS